MWYQVKKMVPSDGQALKRPTTSHQILSAILWLGGNTVGAGVVGYRQQPWADRLICV